jgi:uncharacterized protein (DUF1697 family)
MQYVALLRGINVGGTNKVDMQRLKAVCEKHGLENVKTYINSGNVIFATSSTPTRKLELLFEGIIEHEFGFKAKILVCEAALINTIAQAIPDHWMNDQTMKCDTMFLWENYNNPHILQHLTIKPDIDDVIYVQGALIWKVDRQHVTKSGMMKVAGTDLYQHMTIRNCNTVRKLALLTAKSTP